VDGEHAGQPSLCHFRFDEKVLPLRRAGEVGFLPVLFCHRDQLLDRREVPGSSLEEAIEPRRFRLAVGKQIPM
jgi:hypothetical protein